MAKSSQCLHLEGLGTMITKPQRNHKLEVYHMTVCGNFYKHFYGTAAARVNKREPVLNCTEQAVGLHCV